MHGSRRLALDFILPHLKPGLRVLDLACGNGWLADHVRAAGGTYQGIDRKPTVEGAIVHDLRSIPWPIFEPFDLAVSCYSLQHLLGDEAVAWREARRHAKRMIVVGRASEWAFRETSRADPLNGYDPRGLGGLALASGWRIVDIRVALYEDEKFTWECGEKNANAFAAMLEPIE